MARMSVGRFADEASAALGSRLVTLLLYGSVVREEGAGSKEQAAKQTANTLLIVDEVDAELLARLATPVKNWVGANHPAPLVMTEQEWRDSADAFPIEYEDIREHHRVLAGKTPWDGVRVNPGDLRRQLEQELMGKLMHLRQAYTANWESPKRLAELVQATRAGFLTMLRAVLRLAGKPASAASEVLLRDAAALIGFSPDTLADPPAYLDAVARTAQYVNRMERKTS